MLARNLQRLRTAKNLTQEKLAELAGISFRGYQDIEYGKIESPRTKTVKALAEALGVTIEDLYGGRDQAEMSRAELIAAIVAAIPAADDNQLGTVLDILDPTLGAARGRSSV